MDTASQVTVSPSDLKFKFALNRQLLATISVNNPLEQRVAFKIKTTAPKKYVVRPSSGVADARSSISVQVIMQAQKEAPQDYANCRDKFMIQVTPLAEGEAIDKDTFNKDVRRELQEHRLRVLMEGPAAPPSPVPETNEGEGEEGSVAAAAGPAGGAGDETRGLRTTMQRMEPSRMASPSGQAETAALRQQLEQANRERQALRAQLAGQQAAGPSTAAARAPGLGMLSFVLVALIAFLVGHYYEAIRAYLAVRARL